MDSNLILGCLISAAIIYGLYRLFARIHKQNNSIEIKNDTQQSNANDAEQESVTSNWDQCYEPTYFMTQNEKAQFRKLINWANENHYYVFAKVRLADLIKPRNNNQKLFWKIQAKHIDFLICDGNLKPKLIIELQDSSHRDMKRKERDDFVKEVLNSCGYKSLWLYSIEKEMLNRAMGINNNEVKENAT